MKKIFTILTVVALTTTISSAQVQWGATVGLNMANVSYSGSGDMDTDMRLGIRLGVTADITLSDAMSLNTGLIYSVKGFSNEVEVFNYSSYNVSKVDADVSFNYLEIPLHVSFAVSDVVSLKAGPYLGIFMGGTQTLDGDSESMDDDGFNAMDIGLTLGTSFNVSEVISIDAGYQMGLTQLDEDGESDLTNSNILIGMTYSFGG
jgi:opacity protein-like surface antigen